MKLMTPERDTRYSQVVLLDFYGIELPDLDSHLADVHFWSAAHHYWCEHEAGSEIPVADFHRIRFLAHLRHLYLLVWLKGDFSQARDDSGNGLEYRQSWNPDVLQLPDPRMFEDMRRHQRFPCGKDFPGDVYLKDLEPPGAWVNALKVS